MISVTEIKEKALRWWNDGSFLSASLRNSQDYFPKEISKIVKVDRSRIHEDYATIIGEQEELIKHSREKKGHGYSLVWEEINSHKTGKNKFISKILFEGPSDYLKFIGKEKEFQKFSENVHNISVVFPELNRWIEENPLLVLKHSNSWSELLKVCTYFKTKHVRDRYYIRELPVSVHTKFIEKNEAIIDTLLEKLIPNQINSLGKDFCSKYGLKNKEKLIRIRILDPQLKVDYQFDDFAIKLSDFTSTTFPGKNIFLAENEMNFLTLPELKSTIAIWSGGGFNVSYLSGISWLTDRSIYYWGDLDAAGLLIYQQLKSYYPQSKSMMMDKDTFDKFYSEGKTTKKLPEKSFKSEIVEEQELFKYLNENLLRLEQEQIPQDYVLKLIGQLND